MRRILVVAALLLMIAPAAVAAQVGPVLNHCIFDWTAPTGQNDLALFNIYVASVSGGPYTKLATVPATSPTGGNAYTTADLCAGQPQGQKFAIIKPQDLANNEGVASAEAPFVYDSTAPGAVTNFRVR